MSTISPVPLGMMTGRSPAAASRSDTRLVVRCSWIPQFRVRVQVPAERDQFVLARGEELVEFLRQVMPEHGRPP